jgi:predicted secreted Zn-dependent protease
MVRAGVPDLKKRFVLDSHLAALPVTSKGRPMRKLVAMCLLSISVQASAEVTETLRYTNYEAKAQRFQPLEKILYDASPNRVGDQVFLGITDWAVNWRLEGIEEPSGKCRITKVFTELSVVIDLPILIGGTARQMDQFNQLLPGLKTHELGHYAIAQQAAAAIDSKIRSLPEASDCEILKSAANEIGSKTLDEYKAKEIQYDVQTNHGKTQGAWWGE